MIICIAVGSSGFEWRQRQSERENVRERFTGLFPSLPFLCCFWVLRIYYVVHAGEITKANIIILTHTIGNSVKVVFVREKKKKKKDLECQIHQVRRKSSNKCELRIMRHRI